MDGKKRAESKIPVSSPSPMRRTGSLRLGKCPPIQEHQIEKLHPLKLNRRHSLQSLNTASSFSQNRDDDADSVASFSSTTSMCSNMSQCDHAHFACNGTTYSGRSNRYVVHCSPHSTETDDYLTPTQRTNRTIRRLRSLLKDAQSDLMEKDKDILRLTKEIVELRLLKVDSNTHKQDVQNNTSAKDTEEDSVDSPPPTNPLLSSPLPRYCSTPPLASSLSDSGHFEELNSPKDISSLIQAHNNQIKTTEFLQRQYEDEIRELKEKQNDKVDSLLQRITDVNDRYYALRPLYEDCKEKIAQLEKLNEELKNNLCPNSKQTELEILNGELLQEKHALTNKLNELQDKFEIMEVNQFNYDQLFIENDELKSKQTELLSLISSKCEQHCNHTPANVQSGHELEGKQCDMEETTTKLQHKEVNNGNTEENGGSIIYELLQKLRIKQEELDDLESKYRSMLASHKDGAKHDPEMTLQFLKSAFYYFLTDRENATGHLAAIESILGFTDHEKGNIERAFLWR